MKITKLLITVFIGSLFITGCRKDDIDKKNFNIGPNPSITYETLVTGLISNEENEALSDVKIVINNSDVLTDEDGLFSFASSILLSSGTLITVEKDGYFDVNKFIFPDRMGHSYVDIKLVQRNDPAVRTSTEIATITSVDGGEIIIPANSYIRASGQPYTGQVNIYSHWYSQDDAEIANTMQGNLTALEDNRNLRQLRTFGIMRLEIETIDGESIELAPGKTISHRFPISNVSAFPIGNINAWRYDTDHGYWIEDDIAITSSLSGANLLEISKLGTWNCSVSFESALITGRITNNETPVANRLIGFQLDNKLVGVALTSNAGIFSGRVLTNENLTLHVYDREQELFQLDIGPFTEDKNLEDIEVQ